VTTVLVKNSLNPFDCDTARLERTLIEVFDEMEIEDGILALQSTRRFRLDMIFIMDPFMTVGQAMTKHLGKGFWTKWNWYSEDVQKAYARLTERQQLLKWAMDVYNSREKKTYGYVRGIH
jgi:hypothetical protein